MNEIRHVTRRDKALGRIVARKGRVEITGRLGVLWHYPVPALPLTPRDTFELGWAAVEYGHPYDRLERAALAAGKAAMQP